MMAEKPKQQNESVTISVDPKTLKRIEAHQKEYELSTRSAVVRDWGRIVEQAKKGAARSGFTLAELLAVIVIISILAGLLLPAINGAVRTARTAACSGEISTLVQALSNFKAKTGVFPPSRIVLSEDGDYSFDTLKKTMTPADAKLLGSRSVQYLRRIWPKMAVSTSGPAATKQTPGGWYDWNGDGVKGGVYVLDGAECLVFFLGGVPVKVDAVTLSTTGFSVNPANPAIDPNSSISANRSKPFYEFNSARLVDLDGDGFPERADNLTGKPLVYFSSYEGSGYDPDDVNFAEEGHLEDGSPAPSIGAKFFNRLTGSPSPNPYTNGPSLLMPGTTSPEYMNKISFQIVSAGHDGFYGPGGWYRSKGDDILPFPKPESGKMPEFGTPPGLARNTRVVEKDNVTSFKAGSLD